MGRVTTDVSCEAAIFSKMRPICHALPYLNLLIHTFAMTMKWLTALRFDASQLFWCNPINAMF